MRAKASHIRAWSATWGLLILFIAGSATAQDQAAANEDDEARGLFLAGEAAFDGGRFEEALEHFERSYELSDRPELLYNIGTTAERLRLDARAIEAYERYLERVPDAPRRANVEGRLRVLREQAAAREIDAPAAPPDPAPTDADEAQTSSGSQGLGWGLGAGGFGLLAGGVIALGLAAASANAASEVTEGTPWVDVSADAERVDRRRGIGIGLLAVGAVLTTVGLVVLSAGSGDDELALRVGPTHLSLEGSF